MDTFHLFGYFCPASSPKELKALRMDISLRNEEEEKKADTKDKNPRRGLLGY